MWSWLDLKRGGNKKVAREEIHGDMTMMDINDTQQEAYRLDNEMWEMVKGLTLEQKKELNGKIKVYCEECRMKNEGEAQL